MTRARKSAIQQRGLKAVPETKLPHCLLEGLIRAFMANGTFGRMAEDAISWASAKGYKDRVQLYRNVRDQVGDYWADMQK